jgi:acetylornithine deacetylase
VSALTIEILRSLVSFDTSNPPRRLAGDEELFRYVAGRLHGSGFDVQVHDLGEGCVNVLAVRGEPTTLFNCHLDTVPAGEHWSASPWQLRVENSRAVALGACDVKGAAACLLAAAASTTGPAAILFTSDEEAGPSRCVRTFVELPPPFVESVVVAEPTGCRAVTAHRGLTTCEGRFEGIAAHGSRPSGRARSAVHDAARWVDAALSRAADDDRLRYDELQGIRLNVGVIEGGVKANVVAPSARVVFGLRPLPNQSGPAVVDELRQLAPDDATVSWTTRFTASALAPDARSLALVEALDLPTGEAVDFWTEAALFAEAGLPAIVFGPGDIEQAHTVDEWIAIEQLETATAVYERLFS